MAEAVHLTLKRTTGGKQIEGESSIKAPGRENTIECIFFQDGTRAALTANGVASGRRTHEPIVLRKRIDKATPELAQAMCNGAELDAEFKFYRPDPSGNGRTEQYYTVVLKGARLASITRLSPDATNPGEATDPPCETISMVFHTITWTYNGAGGNSIKTHTDKWDQPE